MFWVLLTHTALSESSPKDIYILVLFWPKFLNSASKKFQQDIKKSFEDSHCMKETLFTLWHKGLQNHQRSKFKVQKKMKNVDVNPTIIGKKRIDYYNFAAVLLPLEPHRCNLKVLTNFELYIIKKSRVKYYFQGLLSPLKIPPFMKCLFSDHGIFLI